MHTMPGICYSVLYFFPFLAYFLGQAQAEPVRQADNPTKSMTTFFLLSRNCNKRNYNSYSYIAVYVCVSVCVRMCMWGYRINKCLSIALLWYLSSFPLTTTMRISFNPTFPQPHLTNLIPHVGWATLCQPVGYGASTLYYRCLYRALNCLCCQLFKVPGGNALDFQFIHSKNT